MCATPGYTQHLGRQRAGQRERFEEHDIRRELLSVVHDVVDHLFDTDLAERAGQEVVHDALRCDAVTRGASPS